MSAVEAGDATLQPAAETRRVRPYLWSMRRELWEFRSIAMVPLVVAGLVVVGFAISLTTLPDRRRATLLLEPAKQMASVVRVYDFAAAAILAASVLTAAFYCLGALHNERRDRGVLFWKSLPVSDLVAVAAKATIPLAVLPAIAFAFIVAVQFLMLLLSSAALSASGASLAPIPDLPLIWATLLYSLVALSLWFAPIYGWLLAVSAWAKRAPFLWAVLPPAAVCVLEQVTLGSHRFLAFLNDRLAGALAQAVDPAALREPRPVPLSALTPLHFLSSVGLWSGLAFAAACFAAAVWLRRHREPL